MNLKQTRYFSTNSKTDGVSFSEALLKGLAPDGGLYMPEPVPPVSHDELKLFQGIGFHEIAFKILRLFTGAEIGEKELRDICRDAYDFDVPLEQAEGKKYILRLDQGPTASFKDFAARIMSRLMQHYLSAGKSRLTILTATSGDTGSAVAHAFSGMGNIKVVILFPKDEVTPVQRKQMTTLRKNITVFSVDGKFDDCQSLVKKAFTDPELSHLPLSSANSINIGRLVPQTIYYFYAWSRVADSLESKIVFSVPSGNFGNVTAGLLARRMGLPVEKFIIATNANDEVPEFLRTGIYKPIVPSRNCLSSAMNVGHPSNLARIIALFGGRMDEKGNITAEPDMAQLKSEIFGVSVTDEETRNVILEEYSKRNLLLEPHGAVAWHGLNRYLQMHPDFRDVSYIAVETAHPAKFAPEIRQILGIDPIKPVSMQRLEEKEEYFTPITTDYLLFKEKLQGI
jgi:threonine synthase